MNKYDLKNRTAIITGGAQGFGLNIAKQFLNFGSSKVIIWDIDENELKKALKEINNPNLSYNVVDVSNFDQVNNAVNKIIKSSNIDILVNNAGITGSTVSLWDYDVSEWNKIVQINLMGTFNCCKCVVPSMIKNNYGRIVNVASVAGKDGNANASAYSAGKAGVIALTKSLFSGVRVCMLTSSTSEWLAPSPSSYLLAAAFPCFLRTAASFSPFSPPTS